MIRPALISLLLATPAAAQTALEATAQNIQLAMTLCLQNAGSVEATVGAFKSAGFSEAKEDFGDGNIIYWMSDPAQLTVTNIQPRPGAGFCAVSTEQFGVSQALPFVGDVLKNIYAGEIFAESPEAQVIRPGAPAASNQPCSGYHFFAPQRLVWVQIGNAGQDPLCIDDGTTQIIMEM